MKKLLLLSLSVLCAACVREIAHDGKPDSTDISLANFNFATTQSVTFQINTLDNHDVPLRNVPIEIGFTLDGLYITLMTGITNAKGELQFQNTVPSYIEELVVRTDYPSLPSETLLPTNANSTIIIGGKSYQSVKKSSSSAGRIETNGFTFLSSFDSNGVPNNLEPVNDYIAQDLLDMINTTLPERMPVPTNNPQYLSTTIDTDTKLASTAEVWVTFVTEGAGYRNALGYYTYPLNSPPATIADIAELKIVFPNVSLPGSGGNLATGSKVSLGTFPANTGIGWFLIPNGWNGSTVTSQPEIKYSTKNLNTYTSAAYRQQTVLLRDATREIILLGMEDLSRPSGDNDFNDAVFYITANPFTSIATDKLVDTKQTAGTDTDSDGVIDRNDKYPNDATKAFDVFTPGAGIYGSIAFEDQWPSKGDYDMNDLVIDYNFQLVANTANAVVEMRANLIVKAVGAAYQNGFGIELPISPNKVASVTGAFPQRNSIDLLANGVEANQATAVIIPFGNTASLFNTTSFVNTKITEGYITPVTLNLVITFTEPIKMTDLGYVPYNPFIFVNGDRAREVHLADFTPTSLANTSLLGSLADSCRPAEGRFYKSGNNMPWAINIALPFEYPQESRPINEAHTKFSTWAQSGGMTYKDWYKNLSGYRQSTLIYKK
jgi:LruC domain-containing protein